MFQVHWPFKMCGHDVCLGAQMANETLNLESIIIKIQPLCSLSLDCWSLGVKHKAPGPNAACHVILRGPDGLKDTRSTFLKEIEEKYPVLLF